MKNYQVSKFLTTAMLLYCIVFISVIGTTGCPARTIEKAKSASAKVAIYANTGVNVTRDMYHQNLISLSAKDKIAQAFIVLADGGIAFDGAVAAIEREYGPNAPPKAVIDRLFAAFDEQVVSRFLNVLTELKVLGNTAALAATIEALKAAVLIIAGAFGKRAFVEGRMV